MLYHTEAESTSYNRDNEKELHVFKDENKKCKIQMTLGEGFRRDFERIMKGQYTYIASIRLEVLTENSYTKLRYIVRCFHDFRMSTPI